MPTRDAPPPITAGQREARRPRPWRRARAFLASIVLATLAVGGAFADETPAAEKWRLSTDSHDDWCLIEHASGDVQIWFGADSSGAPFVTVDVRQDALDAFLWIDNADFEVAGERRSDAPDFAELALREEVAGFLRALGDGRVMRAGRRFVRLDGIADHLASRKLNACLFDVGWTSAHAPRVAAVQAGLRVLPGGVIHVSGAIDRLFAVELEAALARAGARPVVVLGNSEGGYLKHAARAARALRRASAWVIVDGECASACVSVMAGGAVRSLGVKGRLGVHRPILGEGKDAASGQAAVVEAADFYRAMGVSIELALIEASVPSEDMRWLTRLEARELGLVND